MYNYNVNSSIDSNNPQDNNQSVNKNDDHQDLQKKASSKNTTDHQSANNTINNTNHKNNDTHNEAPNIINNHGLPSPTDHHVMAGNTKSQQKKVKSQTKLISKHVPTRSINNNMSIKHYFKPTSRQAPDNSMNGPSSKSENENTTLPNSPLDLNPPPPITTARHQIDSLPTQSQQPLHPLPDTVVPRKRPRSLDPPPSSPILANKRRPKGHCSPGTAEGPSGQG